MSELKFKEVRCSIWNSLTIIIEISKDTHKTLNTKIEEYVNSIIPDPMFYFPVQETNTPYYENLKTHVNEAGIKMSISKPRSIIRDLVTVAISESPTQMLKPQHIYKILHKKYPYFRYCISTSQAHWRGSVRHELSNHASFTKIKVVSPGRNCTWLYWGVVRRIQPKSYQMLTLPFDNFIPADSSSDLSEADIKISVVPTQKNNYETVALILRDNHAKKISILPSMRINTECNKNHSIDPMSCENCAGISLVPIEDNIEVSSEEFELKPNENLIGPVQVTEQVIKLEVSEQEMNHKLSTNFDPESIKIKKEPQSPLKDHQEFFTKTPKKPFTNLTTPDNSIVTESLYNKVSVSPSCNIQREFGVNLTNSGVLKGSAVSPFSPSSPTSRRKVPDPLLSCTQSKKKKCSRKLHLSEDEGSSEEERTFKSKENAIDKTLGVFLKNKGSGTLLSPKGNSEKTVYLSLPFTRNELEPLEEMDPFSFFKGY